METLDLKDREVGQLVRLQADPPLNVLVTENEPDLRALMGKIMKNQGFQVFAVGDGREALDVYRQIGDQINVIVLDMNMPGMDGDSVLRELRRLGATIPVVIRSALRRAKCCGVLKAARLPPSWKSPLPLELSPSAASSA